MGWRGIDYRASDFRRKVVGSNRSSDGAAQEPCASCPHSIASARSLQRNEVEPVSDGDKGDMELVGFGIIELRFRLGLCV